MSRNLTVINRTNNKSEILTPSQRRRIRKYEGKAFMSGVFPNFRLHLPYYAASINALFPYRPAVNDSMMVKPSIAPIPDLPEVQSSTAPVSAKSKMTMELASEIRRNLHGVKASDIAKKLGVGETTVRDILKGKTWKEAANIA